MQLRKIKVFIASSILFTPYVSNAEQTYPFVLGVGHAQCSVLVNHFSDQDSVGKYQFSSWVHGFITGLNFERSEQVGAGLNNDFSGIELYIVNYCEKNPFDMVLTAAKQTYNSLRERGL